MNRIVSAADMAIMLEKDTTYYTPPNKQDLVTIFKVNTSFDLGTDSIEKYIKDKPESLDDIADKGQLRKQLQAYQRIYRLTPDYEEMSVLMNDNLDSAQSINNIGKNAFVNKYGKTFGSVEKARIIYENALQVIVNENALQISEKPMVFFASFTFIYR